MEAREGRRRVPTRDPPEERGGAGGTQRRDPAAEHDPLAPGAAGPAARDLRDRAAAGAGAAAGALVQKKRPPVGMGGLGRRRGASDQMMIRSPSKPRKLKETSA